MDRVSDLAGVDLPRALALEVSADAIAEVLQLCHQVDELRIPADKPGWAIGPPPPPVLTDHPISRHLLPKVPASVALATVLERTRDPDDLLEYALEVWHDGDGALLVTAAVEVGCFCAARHQTHPAAESSWSASTEAELLEALDHAVSELTGWAGEGADADEWRRRAELPAR
jgi:hypothetical protein